MLMLPSDIEGSFSELFDNNGLVVSDHKGKEKILWDDFRIRLGTSDFDGFQLNPGFFFQGAADLSHLEEPFTHEEIDLIIKGLPNDKSPGPDGFNNEFLKKC